MPPVGFETTISAGKRPKTYALDRAATETGCIRTYELTIPWLLWHIYNKRPLKDVVTTATFMLQVTAEAIGHWIWRIAQVEIVSISEMSAMQQTS